MTYGRAALQGALTEAPVGVFLGLLVALLSWLAPAESNVALVLGGAAMGALWGRAVRLDRTARHVG